MREYVRNKAKETTWEERKRFLETNLLYAKSGDGR
jgi:hypothetical protein